MTHSPEQFQTEAEYVEAKRQRLGIIPGKIEMYGGKLTAVLNPERTGWWRFHDHIDRDGYCDNPARGY